MNATMTEFFYSGLALELAILFMLVESVALLLWWRYRAPAADISGTLISLFSGVLLMAAVYCAVIQGPWQWLALFLMASFVTHIVDLRRRWQREERTRSFRHRDLRNEAVNARSV
jgi:hypothetical protein